MCDLAGELEVWPDKDAMVQLLKQAGFKVYVGRYSIRIEDFDHFVFQAYGGDLGDPCIDADAPNAQSMIEAATRVSGFWRLLGSGIVSRSTTDRMMRSRIFTTAGPTRDPLQCPVRPADLSPRP